MARTTVDALLQGARKDRFVELEYTGRRRRIQRAMSEALFRLRKGASLTQAALGERTGWQQPYVARIERGEAQMITALEGLEAFAQATDTSAVVLFVDRTTGQVRQRVALGEAPASVATVEQTVAYDPRAARVYTELDDQGLAGVAGVRQLKFAPARLAPAPLGREIKYAIEDMERRLAELRVLTERAQSESSSYAVDVVPSPAPAVKK